MLKYSEIMEDKLQKNRKRIKDAERIRHLIPLTNKLVSSVENCSAPWIDYEGFNISIWNMKKREVLDFLDTFFWQNDLETTEPKVSDGEIKVKYYGPPVPGKGSRPAIVMTFCLTEGDGCFRVPVGHGTVTKYEWKYT